MPVNSIELIKQIYVLLMYFWIFILSPFNGLHVVTSPDGTIDPGAKAYSLNGKYYIMEVEPYNYGNIGLFDRKTDEEILVWNVDYGDRNNVKGLAWSINSKYFAVMYHKDNYSYITVYDVDLEYDIGTVSIMGWYHYMAFGYNPDYILLSENEFRIFREAIEFY